jgi:ArsR family transcriptional regulator
MRTIEKERSDNGPGTESALWARRTREATMNSRTKAHYQARAAIIKAMSHPTRLFIVDELSRGERCVCELTQMVGDDVSTVSKHLSVLKNAGIVTDKKRGAQVFYTLRVPCILNFFSCVNSVLKAKAL